MLDPAIALLAFLFALAFDLLVGEYPSLLHPVVWIGTVISALLRPAPCQGWWRQLAYGSFIVVVVTTLTAAAGYLAVLLSKPLPWLQVLLAGFLLKASFALCELRRAAVRVLAPLEKGDLASAREALRGLCSRDPSLLAPDHLLAAVIESLAENASDSVVAPLFWFLVGGVPAALAYRAINTLDARIGYRGPYEALGKAAARLDDVVNWIPARLTALLFLVAGVFLRLPVREGWRVFRRDGYRTPSPNAGRPMAVMAGLLHVELAKPGVYILGDPGNPLVHAHVHRAWRVVFLACFLLSIAMLLRFGIEAIGESLGQHIVLMWF